MDLLANVFTFDAYESIVRHNLWGKPWGLKYFLDIVTYTKGYGYVICRVDNYLDTTQSQLGKASAAHFGGTVYTSEGGDVWKNGVTQFLRTEGIL